MIMVVSVGSACHLGIGEARGGRRRNEDNALVCAHDAVTWWESDAPTTRPQPGEGVLLAVCDGMGGHQDGDVASSTAVRVLSKLYQPGLPKNAVRVLTQYLHESHQTLHKTASQHGPVTMGTTVTAAWLLGGHLSWVQVGDSRLYLQRGPRLFQLTADQTRNEFARRDGRPPTADGEHLAQSFIYGSRGLGNDRGLRLDKGIDCGTEALEKGDRLLLCTDGLWGSVPDAELDALLRASPEPQQGAEGLVEAALRANTRDNVTALVVRVDEVPPRRGDEWADDPEETVQF